MPELVDHRVSNGDTWAHNLNVISLGRHFALEADYKSVQEYFLSVFDICKLFLDFTLNKLPEEILENSKVLFNIFITYDI
jgi:hypothetical protein